MKKKAGRPPLKDPLVPLNVRVPASLLKRCQKAAKSKRVPLRAWVRAALDDAAGH